MITKLIGGRTVTVDDQDAMILAAFKWCLMKNDDRFYVTSQVNTNGKPKTILLHRMITRSPKGVLVDHKDRNGLNNCRENLRQCNHSQNASNSKAPINKRVHKWDGPMYRGVQRKPEDKGKFTAWIGFKKETHYLGRFEDAKSAALAYDAKAREFHGEFATLNFP